MVREAIKQALLRAANRLMDLNSPEPRNLKGAIRLLRDRNRRKRISAEQDDLLYPALPRARGVRGDLFTDKLFKPIPNLREHHLTPKRVINPNKRCLVCRRRLISSMRIMALKCQDCRAKVHPKCRKLLPIPCVPAPNDLDLRFIKDGKIEDYVPKTSPMVPSLIVHCTREVELRGMKEEGLYRSSGNADKARELKDEFLKNEGAPILSEIDIPVITSALKDFLKSLAEPLIPAQLRDDFIRAATIPHDRIVSTVDAIRKLPQPNRDTLAHLIHHLQRVSVIPENRMTITNLAKVFGPTLVGYGEEITPESLMAETENQTAVVEALLKVPSNLWAQSTDSQGRSGMVPLGEDPAIRRFVGTLPAGYRGNSFRNKQTFQGVNRDALGAPHIW